MPGHTVHRYYDRLVLGKSYDEVHRALDRPYSVLRGQHRRLFHTPEEAYMIGVLASSGHGGGVAGLSHVWLDKKCSKDKEFKKLLKLMAKEDARWRKQMRRWKKLMKKQRRS